MMEIFLIFSVIIYWFSLIGVSICRDDKPITTGFALQYIGDYVTAEEEVRRDFCSNKYCVIDSNLLFYAASQNSSADPCVDFREFAVGTFAKYRAINDRYFGTGFQIDSELMHQERQRRLLALRFDGKKDGRTFKVMKNFFKKCVSSKYVEVNSTSDILSYVDSIGGSPFVTGQSWNATKFNLSSIIETEPTEFLAFFLDHRLERCPTSSKNGRGILCLKFFDWWIQLKNFKADFSDMIHEMKDSQSLDFDKKAQLDVEIAQVHEHLDEFFELKRATQTSVTSKPRVVQIKNLQSHLPDIQIDWLKVINKQLRDESKVTEDETIFIENLDLIGNLLKIYASADRKVIAEAFASSFLYSASETFITYSYTRDKATKLGKSRPVQRWQQCLYRLNIWMKPAMEMLYNRRYFNQKLGDGARSFAREAIEDIIQKLKKEKSELPDEVVEVLVTRLNQTTIVTSITEQQLPRNMSVDDFYSDLKLTGDEGLVESYLAIQNHNQKILREPRTSEIKKLEKLWGSYLSNYNMHEGTLFIPALCFSYPFYHPDRPRFFNTATFYALKVQYINTGIEKFLKKIFNIVNIELPIASESYQMGHENFVRWERNGGRDLQLGANLLTNRQLYWMAVALVEYLKFHPSATADNIFEIYRSKLQNFHVFIKHNKGFQDDYQCKMTAEEQQQWLDYKN